MAQSALTATVDARTVAPRDRHSLIFATFRALAPGQAMQLVNDHDPRPLYYQFQAEMPEAFAWEYLERGPELWRVEITRRDASVATKDSCCGACGGA